MISEQRYISWWRIESRRNNMILIDLDELVNSLNTIEMSEFFGEVTSAEIREWLDAQPIVARWHKLIFRPLTFEEKEFDPDCIGCVANLPDFGEEVLVTDGTSVWVDSFDVDDCVYLSGTGNDLDGVIAWMELPSYKE